MLITGVIIVFTMLLTRVFIVPIILGAFKLKQKIHNMNEKKWDIYLAQLSAKGYVHRIIILILFPMILSNTIGYLLLRKRHTRKKACCLTIAMFLVDGVRITCKLMNHREEMVEHIMNIKKAALGDL